MPSKKTVHVAVGVIQRQSNLGRREILISKRHADVHQGGLWEFPGGKVEKDETLPLALARELEEELGITLDPSDENALRPLIQIFHDYGDKAVLLDVWLVSHFANAPENGIGQEGQQVRWVDVERLNDFSFPQANVPIISACQLPEYYHITPVYEDLATAKERIARLSNNSSGLILFRQPQLASSQYFSWLNELLVSFPDLGDRLMLSANVSDLDQCDYDKVERELIPFEQVSGKVKGIHLPFKLAGMFKTRMFQSNILLAISCHSQEELEHAERLGADLMTLSPVRETLSHPGTRPLGWSQFEEWVKLVARPVYALGGMSESDLKQSFKSGAQGVSGISAWAE